MRPDSRPRAPGLTLLALLSILYTNPLVAQIAPPAPPATESQPQPVEPPAPTAAALERASQAIRAAGSSREVAAELKVMVQGKSAALPYFERLLSGRLHPEVELTVISDVVSLDVPGSLPFAKRYIQHPERTVRTLVARRLLKGNYDAAVADAMIKAIPTETDEETLQLLLAGLGFAPPAAQPRVITFLRGLLATPVADMTLDGTAWALGYLRDEESAPRILELLTPERPAITVDRVLQSVHGAMGRPESEAELAAIAMKPGPLRLWAVDRLRFSGMMMAKSQGQRPPAVWAAAQAALDDPNPMTRGAAVLALTTPSGNFPYCTDLSRVTAAAGQLKDTSPYVRQQALDSLHETVLRRGIQARIASPLPLEPTTMRMLRWPADWITFPAIVAMLDDPDEEVRVRAIWILGIATGYWYGYSDIHLTGKPDFSAGKAGYQKMIDEMKPLTARTYTVNVMENAVQSITTRREPRELNDLFRGVKILTGQSFGWTPKATPAEMASAGPQLAAWWAKNKTKHPVEWIMETVLANGITSIDEYSMHALERWGYGSLPREILDKRNQSQKPAETAKNVEAWWKTVKAQL